MFNGPVFIWHPSFGDITHIGGQVFSEGSFLSFGPGLLVHVCAVGPPISYFLWLLHYSLSKLSSELQTQLETSQLKASAASFSSSVGPGLKEKFLTFTMPWPHPLCYYLGPYQMCSCQLELTIATFKAKQEASWCVPVYSSPEGLLISPAHCQSWKHGGHCLAVTSYFTNSGVLSQTRTGRWALGFFSTCMKPFG